MNMVFRNVFLIVACISLAFTFSCKQKKQKQKKVITREMLLEHNRNLVDLENKVIRDYLDTIGIEMQQSKTGLWYKIDSDSVGETAREKDMVHLNYKIMLMDSAVCYSSEKNGMWSFEVGKGSVETGIEEGILLMSEGDEASFILRPNMAHGLSGDGDRIPGRAILLYQLELIKIDRSEHKSE
ncbi:FKBP-type peptidyl-prolyl cis-trans isomerase [Carboxylicivirga sp. N1Y90]|uniref:FKBP-type peptidyl-prolyl cis-trans isomerase n=1 Tax=Carboxylicivirga fragile TaxID=3417571 RepID=UPI003D3597C9|nr:FKBP-type peptidyl-prolyl cis-trans isomerase [Marinilabiliaceae bacterium N1Y90]